MAGGERYEFGEFALEASERRLSRSGEPVALAPKTYEVLVALVRHAGRLVTKRQLLELVWPEAFVEEGILAVHISGLRKALGDRHGGPRYIETVPRSGYRFTAAVKRAGSEPRWSVAVLPAKSLETEPSGSDRSLGLAIADALIDRLGRFEQIVVRPTRAVHTYTDASQDPAAVGRSLCVDAVVESGFRRKAGRIEVSARVVRSYDGAPLWGVEFEEAQVVAESMAARCPEVYELFGRGRAHLLAASMFEVPKAVAAFREAIALDPTYAAAHAGLALAHCAQAEFRVASPAEAYSEARAAALRALAMDDTCADAQVALGAVLFLSEWNWVGAERSLARALEINPNHTEGYLLYGRLLEALGELERGLAMKQKALERDPFSPLVHLQIALSYWNQRRYDDSIAWANKALELDPRHLLAREHLAGAYWKKGDFDRHMAEVIKHAESYGVAREILDNLRQIYATGGRAAIVQYALKQGPGGNPVQLALLHGESGDLDAAFRHLERALEGRDPCLVHLAVAPQWDSLRADARFGECLARMGLNQPLASISLSSSPAPNRERPASAVRKP